MKTTLTKIICLSMLLLETIIPGAIYAQTRLSALDGSGLDETGKSVALYGDVAILGTARANTSQGQSAGAAYVFRRNGTNWPQEQKLLASDGAAYAQFGGSVAIDQNVVVVGAPAYSINGSNIGAAYVFRWNGSTWIQEAKLLASDGVPYDAFGTSVTISGNSILVGALTVGPWNMPSNKGAAYVFRFNGSNWVQEGPRLVASDGLPGDRFGFSVALSGDFALIGAYTAHPQNQSQAGAAYIFRRVGTTWSQQQKLERSDNRAYELYGHSTALKGNLAVIGTLYDGDIVSNGGSAYLFRYNGSTWAQETELHAADSVSASEFGASVDVEVDGQGNELVLVGTPNFANTNPMLVDGKGAAYLYRKNGSTWVETKFTNAGGLGYDRLGTSVSISSGFVLAGAPGCDNGSKVGAGYIFTLGGGSAPSIVLSNPPNNIIDPLEDRDATSGVLLGTKDISITFSSPVTNVGGGALSLTNFERKYFRGGTTTPIEVSAASADLASGGVAPTVTLVSGSGAGPYLLRFSPRIPLGAWTQIKAINVVNSSGTPISTTANKIVIGSAPMDVTQDGKVLGDDISRWLAINSNAVNPAPLTKLQLIDQRRDGVVNGADINRAIQLINGIGTFRVWSGFDLGVRP